MGMRGGSTTIQAPETPSAPSVQETSAQAIQAQIDALPKILAAQKEFGPQFSVEQLKSLSEFGPQFAQAALDLQKEYGPQFAEVERAISPELGAASRTLSEFLNQTDQQEYEALKPGLLEDVRAAQSLRGLGDISPLGSIDESVQLQRLRQSLKDRRLNIALSTAGRIPISGMPTVQGQTGVGQLVQNVSPESIFNYQSGLNNFNSSLYQSGMYGYANQPQGSSIMGSILGTLGGSASGALGSALGAGTAALGGAALEGLGGMAAAALPAMMTMI